VLSWRLGNRRPEREWTVFAAGAVVIVGVYVLGFFYFGFRTAGEPGRLVPELDLALILGSLEAIRTLWNRPRLRPAAVLLTVIAFTPAVRYLEHARSPFPKAPPVENVYEYKMAKWVNGHLPGERVLPTGTVRFWFDAWFDNAQLDGGSMQGMLNQIIPVATWQIIHGDRADLAILWLKALGTGAVVAPDQTAFEHYREFLAPHKFRGAVPVLYDDGHGTVIYKIPRIHPDIARVVDNARIGQIGQIRGGDDKERLTEYVTAIENPAQLASTLTWRGFDEMEIHAKAEPGQSVLVQETWDPAWHADDNGRQLPIRIDPMGFMLIPVPEGAHNIRMRFVTPLENRVGQVLFVLTALLAAGLVTMPRRFSPDVR